MPAWRDELDQREFVKAVVRARFAAAALADCRCPDKGSPSGHGSS